ncbi:hypothetical protein HO133_009484 [Letharia lupina]|uniref:N-acetyltransferase domain-containing protein n=1 Tax=Letharia lupina TaxID=560253 RepID=A0A8H6FF23_9LECA|nr:uncharacterized protein HO133_009484 [Letharia lupina]KAF6225484.1 hypothetical protein HO133_009484 [Letharia lupina]
MPNRVPVDISRWARTDWWRRRPSVDELILLHHELHQLDKFAQVMYLYPFGKDTMARTIEELITRKDYEFFFARLQSSNQIVGWVALSFDIEGKEVENRADYGARLEWTAMCSHILKLWQFDSAGKKINVWDTIKQASSSLQAKHLPHDHCIINTFVLHPDFQKAGVANGLLEHAVELWSEQNGRHGCKLRTSLEICTRDGFEEVGDYAIDLGDYGFWPKEKRTIVGKYVWKFMVLRGASGLATEEPEGARKHDNGKSKEQQLENVREHVAARKLDKGEDDYLAGGEPSEHDEERTKWEEAEQRLEEIRSRRGLPPLPGEVACMSRIQCRAENRGHDPTGLSKGKGVEKRSRDARTGTPGEPLRRPLQSNAEVTGQPQDDFWPTGSEEDLIEVMRTGGIDEEEIKLVEALAFSLSNEETDFPSQMCFRTVHMELAN